MKSHEGKYIFGVVKVSEKGQIVIPKEARQVFNIQAGETLLVVGDISTGLALIKQGEVFNSLLIASSRSEEQ